MNTQSLKSRLRPSVENFNIISVSSLHHHFHHEHLAH